MRLRARGWWVPLVLGAATACAGGTATDAPQPEPRGTEGAVVDTATASGTTGTRGSGEQADAAAVRPDTAGPTRTPPDDTLYREERDAAGESVRIEPRLEEVAEPEPYEPPVPILPGAVLPGHRIVAFYGNPASKRMGILGEVPPDEMLDRLDREVRAWKQADPDTPVRPALQMIAVMATGDPGRDSLFRLRMPDHRIRQVASWAARRDGLLFLDIQPGWSTVAAEIEPFADWLARPHVHLALDPEWDMPPGAIPGRVIGSMSAADINHAIDFLADLVERHNLPPKVLVVHRFTESMIREAHAIRRDPRVQVVINMDGWGAPPNKKAAYRDVVAPEADQYTGIKLFFHNDVRNGSVLLTPDEILELQPAPVYIQYQ